jgi:hypothetical protein
MEERTTMTADDVGKRVVTGSGEEVGRVVGVSCGSAHVNPHPGLVGTVRTTLGWEEQSNEDTDRLNDAQVDTITDEEIRLRS